MAGFTGVMATAWHALVKMAHLQRNETVLIHCEMPTELLQAIRYWIAVKLCDCI